MELNFKITLSLSDVTPPILLCPDSFSVPMATDDNFAVVKVFPPPEVADNSGDNTTFWLKPAVKSDGVKLTLGNHTFTYVAIDASRNKAKCTFIVNVLDITPPVLDNCIDPPEVQIPSSPFSPKNLSFVDWEAPIIYDNSNAELEVTQSLEPGYLGIGTHRVKYVAVDPSGNSNECTLNVTVKQLECGVLASPPNGLSLCAKNVTHTWCEVTCDLGHAIYDELAESHLDNFVLLCENDFAKWEYETIPDCTVVELPEAIEEMFSITLDSDAPICNNSMATLEVGPSRCDAIPYKSHALNFRFKTS